MNLDGIDTEFIKKIMEGQTKQLVTALPCPLCKADQVQVCLDSNNPQKDFARCRLCFCQAPLKIWNSPRK
jgi:transcription elongation factor Elf1